MRRRLAVVGAGWAGLAAAVEAVGRGDAVSLFEMAAKPGGRARQVDADGPTLDNGQHLMIGAYTETLALMRRVGVDPDTALLRLPLDLRDPDGHGLCLPPGPAWFAFARGSLGVEQWSFRERASLLLTAGRWLSNGFRCPADWTVERLCAAMPLVVRRELIEPLCVAALNTPAANASATVFLRVLRDALFAGRGCADLLIPRQRLSALLPAPAVRWLQDQGARVQMGQRVQGIERQGDAWAVDGEDFDHVVVATTAVEAARLVRPIDAGWSATAGAIAHEPIVTVYLQCDGTRLSRPMSTLHADACSPAQFVFDLGQLGGEAGLLAFVVSGAADWIGKGSEAVGAAVLGQARAALALQLRTEPRLLRVLSEKRATFACTPQLSRPRAQIAPHLHAAGDYVEGPYPATLEGAVRSGLSAVVEDPVNG